jgi:hypothetical protein
MIPDDASIKDKAHYTFCGHLHPASVSAVAEDNFYNSRVFILEIISGYFQHSVVLQGCVNVDAQKGENVFAIVEKGIMQGAVINAFFSAC